MNKNNDKPIFFWIPANALGKAATLLRKSKDNTIATYNFYWAATDQGMYADNRSDDELKLDIQDFVKITVLPDENVLHFRYMYEKRDFERVADPKWIQGLPA